MERDFEISGRKFRLSKIDAFKQFHIARRICPILTELAPELKDARKLEKADKLSEEEKFDILAKLATPVMTGLSKLSDSDADFVLFGLLASIEVQQAQGNWAKIVANQMCMMQDLELSTLLQLASKAFIFNLSGFFAALPQT